ncbi:uncharacterized protein LOC143006938 [Genypterus blacodes]|uniref:uncharacterized protein LOC143006938 n=1 Tax=Genypterus blacodes TaxID=154954 RepID=UPI003F769B6B
MQRRRRRWTPHMSSNMSRREEMKETASVQKSHATVGTQKDKKSTPRLYPSLPHTQWCEEEEPESSPRETLPAAAARLPDSLLGNKQSAVSGSSKKAQIVILEAQRKELLSINERWAKEYNTMVQYYREKRGNSDVTSELWKAECEAKRLTAQNSTLTRRGQHQQEEIKRLNMALEEALQVAQPPSEGGDTHESVWKHQADVFKEDFMTERRDREKLKGKHLELENKFRKAEKELRILRSQMSCRCKHRDEPPNREGHICAKACQDNHQHCQLERHKHPS